MQDGRGHQAFFLEAVHVVWLTSDQRLVNGSG
jgi:hypothetical protein